MVRAEQHFIRSAADFGRLITLQVTTESRHLDFKTAPDGWPTGKGTPEPQKKKSQREACRDIAQFANGDGGCLLFGVSETLNASGMKIAERLASISDSDKLREWIEQAVANYCVPRTFGFEVSIVQLGADVVVAVNVPPSQHTVYVWDKEAGTMQVFDRTNHGKRALNPDELERHIMNASRAARLAVESLAQANQRVVLASPVYRVRPETDPEYFTRLKKDQGITSGFAAGKDHPKAPRLLVEFLDHDVACFVQSVDERQLTVALYGRQLLSIPYGVIREVWEYSPGVPATLALLLDCSVVASPSAVVLRRGA